MPRKPPGKAPAKARTAARARPTRRGKEIELINPRVSEYLEALVPKRDVELGHMERIARATNFPIIGPAVGQLCYLLTRAVGARQVFELGSGFGYSTAWFARAVRENGGGTVHHVVWDEDLSRRARDHLGALGCDGVVRYTVGEAVETLRHAEGTFDVIFNDIDKQGYPDALPVIEARLRPGGLLITDNLLWSGRIFDAKDRSGETAGIRAFTRRVFDSPNWSASIVPIRDGVLVARRN